MSFPAAVELSLTLCSLGVTRKTGEVTCAVSGIITTSRTVGARHALAVSHLKSLRIFLRCDVSLGLSYVVV